MKIRIGFVSNSSSSSFCIVGVEDEDLIQQLCAAEGFEIEGDELQGEDICLSSGVLEGKVVSFFGSDYTLVHYAGIAAVKMLQTMTIPEACNEFADRIKEKFDIELPDNSVGFYYGETGGY